MRALLLSTIGLVSVAQAETGSYIDGDLRVQILSSSIVRLELKGPKGFEDRKTFTVVNRSWAGSDFKVVKQSNATLLRAKGFVVQIPADRKGLRGIRVLDGKGKELYSVANLPEISYLPAPAKMSGVYAMADAPRMATPEGGAIPASATGPYAETNGFDTANDSTDMYLFVTKDYKQLRKDFLKLTGPVPMVPRFLMGFTDSRWFPYTEETALADIDAYQKRGIPLDMFVVDTDWRIGASKGYGPNTQLFPDMTRFIRRAHDKGVRLMYNDHPEPQYASALDPKEIQYRWDGLTSLLSMGLDVWWYDRNWSTSLKEPMPGIRREVWGASIFHDITQAYRPNQRPILMSNVSGIDNGIRNYPAHPAFHRYPIWWTGDTGSTWQYLQYGVQNGVDMGTLNLLPYVNEDLGGHTGKPGPELYVRSLQYGALCPVMRVHCTFGLNRHPWEYGPEVEKITTDAIKFRYRLLPTLYSAAHQAFEDGTPILRRLDVEYPKFEEASSNSQYMLGDDLLVSPVQTSVEGEGKPIEGMFHTEDGKEGLKAEYFANMKLEGTPAVVRTDANVQFDWEQGSPDPAIPSDGFSARWTGKIGPMAKTMEYKFSLSSDDGSRLFIDGKKVIDSWRDQAGDVTTGKITLEQGKTYDIKLEYYENSGGALCHLGWFGENEPAKLVTNKLWVPPGTWRDLWSGQTVVGPRQLEVAAPLNKVPLLVREGSIIFLGAAVPRADEQLKKGLTAEVFLPATGKSVKRSMYEDDGISNDYLRGVGSTRVLEAKNTRDGYATVELKAGSGSYKGMQENRDWTIRVHLPSGSSVSSVTLDGQEAHASIQHSVTGEAKSILDVFEPRGSDVVELTIKGVPHSAGHVIRLNFN